MIVYRSDYCVFAYPARSMTKYLRAEEGQVFVSSQLNASYCSYSYVHARFLPEKIQDTFCVETRRHRFIYYLPEHGLTLQATYSFLKAFYIFKENIAFFKQIKQWYYVREFLS